MGAEEIRPIEEGVVRDFSDKLSYSGYLHLDSVLTSQHLLSDPEHHDEMLFIIQHQTSELWFKLVLHELHASQRAMDDDDLDSALKKIARVKHIQRTLTEQWSVLATLTPSEYAGFRGYLGNSSGFQSAQYRAVEFLLGNKDPNIIGMFDDDRLSHDVLAAALVAPSIYDSLWRYLDRHGHDVPRSVLDRDVSQPWSEHLQLIPLVRSIYEDPRAHWRIYETFEELVDLEENFQLWRFRHLRTVLRTIGIKRGTGGSSGADFLARALSLTFFPELFKVRTEIDLPTDGGSGGI